MYGDSCWAASNFAVSLENNFMITSKSSTKCLHSQSPHQQRWKPWLCRQENEFFVSVGWSIHITHAVALYIIQTWVCWRRCAYLIYRWHITAHHTHSQYNWVSIYAQFAWLMYFVDIFLHQFCGSRHTQHTFITMAICNERTSLF